MYTKGELKMIKSIRILLLLALIQISLSSCLLWKGAILTLKQSSAYFLVFIVLTSGLCAGMNFFYTQNQDVHSIINSQKKVKLFYSTLLVLNLVGVCLVLSETILTQTAFQQELVDLFLPSFFFLFGIDLLVFLPFEKYSRDLGATLNKKKNSYPDSYRNLAVLEKSNDSFIHCFLCWFRLHFCSVFISEIHEKRIFLLRPRNPRYFTC